MGQSGFGALGWSNGSTDVWPEFPMRILACFLQDTILLVSTKHSNQSTGLGTRPLKIRWATGSMARGAPVAPTRERLPNPFSFCAMALHAISWAWLVPCCLMFFVIEFGRLQPKPDNLLKRGWLRFWSFGSLNNFFLCLRAGSPFGAANGWPLSRSNLVDRCQAQMRQPNPQVPPL